MGSLGTGLRSWLTSLFVGFTLLQAQPPAGEIRLEVKDPSGAAVEAPGTLRNLATSVERIFLTDARGSYVFASLPAGRYRIQISKSGFAPQSIEVNVVSGTLISRTITLALGTQSSRVDVVAATPLAGTELSRNQIAGPVQTATAADVEGSGRREWRSAWW